MKPPPLKSKIVTEVQKAKNHLEYSFRKVQKMPLDHELDEEELETGGQGILEAQR